jgi:diguanylate cyclase (GGDEF)-like protein/PAS domain S-box-containing protein
MTTARHVDTGIQRKRRNLQRMAWLPVTAALVGIWILMGLLTTAERQHTIDRVSSQLRLAVMTLADFNEIAEQVGGDAGLRAAEHRTAAIWRMLLEYPTASIWVESDGIVTGGQEPTGALPETVTVQEVRNGFTVNAALPTADALADWDRSIRRRLVVLLVASVAFLLLTAFLIRALEQRSLAEQELATQRERSAALSRYKAELEETVDVRTHELKDSNDRLAQELVERKAAEARLKEHDALLNVVTKSAAELLGSHSLDDTTAPVLDMIGTTLAVSRVHISRMELSNEGHLYATVIHAWCTGDKMPVSHKPSLTRVDLTAYMPEIMGPLLSGNQVSFTADEVPEKMRPICQAIDLRACLLIPIMVEGALWGAFAFIDSSPNRREWSWAETDTLQTLAGLYGDAVARASYVKNLADANMIVQNSPTILYRLRGEPPFPLIYISTNIRKFGHDPAGLVGQAGWTGVLMDPDDEAKVSAAMARTVEKDAEGAAIEFRLRTADNTWRWVENRYTPVRDPRGRLIEIEGMIIDITERKAAEERIAQMARTDGLTGLANRGTFIEQLRQSFAAARRGSNPFAIMYLDLDHFKTINDTLGHQTGDGLLREVAARLKSCARESDVIARLGGDEFAVLQTEMIEPANAGTLAASIQSTLSRPYLIDGNELHVTTSIGICPYVAGSAGPDAMLAQADLALYRSKEEGRNRYRFHSDDLDHQVLERIRLADELRTALDNDELEVYYQPQVELATGRIVGTEALLRWHHPQRGLLPAAAFVPVAEKTGTIVALGQWLLERACEKVRYWRDKGIDPGVLTINLSFAQLKSGRELLGDVRKAIERWQLTAADLSFDVTEATLAKLTLMHSDILLQLRDMGARIAIADFGSEYSSLNYLRTYHVNHLKLTQGFVDAAAADQECAATMRAIITLARELDIDVITQGVETARQLDLSTDSASIVQGHYFSEALDDGDVTALLRAGRIRRPPQP